MPSLFTDHLSISDLFVSVVCSFPVVVCVVQQDHLDLPFNDENFRRRRAHPNFKQHIDLEKRVVKMGKTVSFKFLSCGIFCRRHTHNCHIVTWLLLSEHNNILHIRGGVRTPVRDGRACPALLFQGKI